MDTITIGRSVITGTPEYLAAALKAATAPLPKPGGALRNFARWPWRKITSELCDRSDSAVDHAAGHRLHATRRVDYSYPAGMCCGTHALETWRRAVAGWLPELTDSPTTTATTASASPAAGRGERGHDLRSHMQRHGVRHR